MTDSAEIFPRQLIRDDYFKCPVWTADAPQFVDDLNSASDKYIQTAKDSLKKGIDKRNKGFGDKGDMGHVFHSTPLIGDPNFKDLTHYIISTSHNLFENWHKLLYGVFFEVKDSSGFQLVDLQIQVLKFSH